MPLSAPLKVALVDDSAVMRSYIRSLIAPLTEAEIIIECVDGRQALEQLPPLQPEVILLDIEMPHLSGLEILPDLKKRCPDTAILMCSTLTTAGAQATFRALARGATDFLGKPTAQDREARPAFEADLKTKLKGLFEARRASATTPKAPSFRLQRPSPTQSLLANAPQILAIGVSTGGPKALPILLKDLQSVPVPIVITQHMPSPFTQIFAKQTTQDCGRPCHEVSEEMVLEKGATYIAKGGTHMAFRKKEDGRIFAYPDEKSPPRQYCKPSVDTMLNGLLPFYGKAILAVILTGMGQDGFEGVQKLVEKGGACFAQDQASSTVWGMPKAVAEGGLCQIVAPLGELAGHIQSRFRTRAPQPRERQTT